MAKPIADVLVTVRDHLTVALRDLARGDRAAAAVELEKAGAELRGETNGDDEGLGTA